MSASLQRAMPRNRVGPSVHATQARADALVCQVHADGEKRLGTKSDETVRLLLGKLTTARWYLDAAASLRGAEAEGRVRKAREVCDEVQRCLVESDLDAQLRGQIQLALTELRSRLRPNEEL